MGYSLQRVALPYQLLTLSLNAIVLVVGILLVVLFRTYYLELVGDIAGEVTGGVIWPMVLVGIVLFSLVSLINIMAIRKKIGSCFYLH